MQSLLANRTTRRRGVAYILLLAVTLILMAFSSSPAVAELQRGVGYAFRPVQSALNDVGNGISSVFGAITEMDQLRISNQALLQENERLRNENARADEIQRENDQLTALLQLRSGLSFTTVASQVVARESSEFKRLVTLDQGSDKGIAAGDVVIAAGGALAGRVTDVGPNFAHVRLMNDAASTPANAANTFFVGCALMPAMIFFQSAPLLAATVVLVVAFPPFFARPSWKAAADSVPNASSPLSTSQSRCPDLATHSPRDSLICHDDGATRKVYLLAQLGVHPGTARVSAFPPAFVSR